MTLLQFENLKKNSVIERQSSSVPIELSIVRDKKLMDTDTEQFYQAIAEDELQYKKLSLSNQYFLYINGQPNMLTEDNLELAKKCYDEVNGLILSIDTN